jgi:hypothetical protein
MAYEAAKAALRAADKAFMGGDVRVKTPTPDWITTSVTCCGAAVYIFVSPCNI